MIHYLIAGFALFSLGILLGYFLKRGEKKAPLLAELGEGGERLFWIDYFSTLGKIYSGIDILPDETGRSDLHGVLKNILEKMEKNFENRQIEVHTNVRDSIPYLSIPEREAQHLIRSLLLNAVEALPGGGQIKINATPPTDKTGDQVKVEIEDNGSGISDELAPKLFTPFFSTKKRGGTGLGLYTARELVERCGGKILMESVESGGTRVILYLPGVRISD